MCTLSTRTSYYCVLCFTSVYCHFMTFFPFVFKIYIIKVTKRKVKTDLLLFIHSAASLTLTIPNHSTIALVLTLESMQPFSSLLKLSIKVVGKITMTHLCACISDAWCSTTEGCLARRCW